MAQRGIETYVYFVQPVCGGPIKIGYTRAPASRLTTMMSWSPFPLRLLATAPGGPACEAYLHSIFSDHRLHSEWFQAAPDLLALIETVKQTGAVPNAPPPGLGRMAGDFHYRTSALGKLMRQHGLTVADLIAETGASPSAVQGWKHHAIPHKWAPKILQFFARRGIEMTQEALWNPPHKYGTPKPTPPHTAEDAA